MDRTGSGQEEPPLASQDTGSVSAGLCALGPRSPGTHARGPSCAPREPTLRVEGSREPRGRPTDLGLAGSCTQTPHLQTPPNVRQKLYQFLWPHDGQDPWVRQKLLVVQPGLLNGQRTGGREVKRPPLPQAPGTRGSPGRDQPAQHRALGAGVPLPRGPGPWAWDVRAAQSRHALPPRGGPAPSFVSLSSGQVVTDCFCGAQPLCVHGPDTQGTPCVCSGGREGERSRHTGRSQQRTWEYSSFSRPRLHEAPPVAMPVTVPTGGPAPRGIALRTRPGACCGKCWASHEGARLGGWKSPHCHFWHGGGWTGPDLVTGTL